MHGQSSCNGLNFLQCKLGSVGGLERRAFCSYQLKTNLKNNGHTIGHKPRFPRNSPSVSHPVIFGFSRGFHTSGVKLGVSCFVLFAKWRVIQLIYQTTQELEGNRPGIFAEDDLEIKDT